ncbi:ABC transporter permease subunit [Siculibacillus lacustris]|uniref:ABC transporter permease subunit n=1 Tax=Siculibacillus lacustris TaxID=1549641 RepID=A0A4Q9VVM6_9HYPH|nr:ABC transporter permease subunit [Siculibacillus lacustris]TBW40309.1 ABC transporter permease subunit [Siculibacillus lacustris]
MAERTGGDRLWGTLGLAGLAAGWSLIHTTAGPFVLPSLADTGTALIRVIADGSALAGLALTCLHAVGGAVAGAAVGLALGLAGGAVRPLGAALAPAVTAILGVPPVAWIVLAFLWFGTGPAAPLFTVAIATAPLLFAATLAGVRARDPALIEMATVFRLPRATRFFRLTLPELAVQVAPALSSAFAMAWKVALTAEVLGDGSGVGGRFATARAHLDLAEAMAWIVLVVAVLLTIDAVLFGPLRRRIDPATPATRDGTDDGERR